MDSREELRKLADDMERVFNSDGPVDLDAFAERVRAIANRSAAAGGGEAGPRDSAPFTLFTGEVLDLESKLPCKVTLHPGASFGKGVPISTMLVGLLHRQQMRVQSDDSGPLLASWLNTLGRNAPPPPAAPVCGTCKGERYVFAHPHSTGALFRPCPDCKTQELKT